jgi:hypothetical protein
MKDRTYLTIVSGLPRSGTSLMMQMLEAGGIPALTDGIRAPDVDNPKGYYEFEPVKKTKEDSSWVSQGVGRVVKMVHLLLLDLPAEVDYRVVFLRRDLDEVVASQDIMLQRRDESSDGISRERLKKVYTSQISTVKEYMHTHADHFKVIEVDYNEIVTDPRQWSQKISVFLDGLDTVRMLETVDPSLYRNRGEANRE